MGMIGGGEGAFIGPVHRMAAELDGAISLVCGAFSADPARSVRSGVERYGLDPARCYPTAAALFAGERARPVHERMQFVTIVTPNHLHAPLACSALEAGFHVVCDKPLALTVADAETIANTVRATGRLFAVTYNYTGYPMVREARELVRRGAIGPVRRVQCEYLQGWLATPQPDNKQAAWRVDPARAGAAGCFGDIGTHCENLVRFVTGLEPESVCADLNRFVAGRALDDDGSVLVRFRGGARGTITASQVAVGEENGLSIRVYGERGGLVWHQHSPNTLVVHHQDGPTQVLRTGGPGVSDAGRAATRLPAGHPEGFLEAFGVLYRNFARAVRVHAEGPAELALPPWDFPGIDDGVAGMRFLAAVVESARRGSVWIGL